MILANASAQARVDTTFLIDRNADGHSTLFIAQQSNDTGDADSQMSASKKEKSNDHMAETAREAYDGEDGKPVENWFGCPPSEEHEMDDSVATMAADSGAVYRDEAVSKNCDSDAVKNESPQKD